MTQVLKSHTDQLINNHPDNLFTFRGMRDWFEGENDMGSYTCDLPTFYKIMGLWDYLNKNHWVINIESVFRRMDKDNDPVYMQRFFVVGSQAGYVQNITRDVYELLSALGFQMKYVGVHGYVQYHEPASVVSMRLQKILLDDGVLDIAYHIVAGQGY